MEGSVHIFHILESERGNFARVSAIEQQSGPQRFHAPADCVILRYRNCKQKIVDRGSVIRDTLVDLVVGSDHVESEVID